MRIIEYWINTHSDSQKRVGMLAWDRDDQAIGGFDHTREFASARGRVTIVHDCDGTRELINFVHPDQIQ